MGHNAMGTRKCARCGKGMTHGLGALTAYNLLVMWARTAGVHLAEPTSAYLHVKCASKLTHK
jgi:hypothetical protein